MTNSPAYLWYPRDVFDSERVEDLSPAEECWYRRALDRSWGDEGISSDPVKAAKRIGKKCTVKAAEMILKVFFVPKRNDATKMVNPRQEKERKKLFEKSKQKSAAGKKGMAKRWKQRSKSDNTVITPLPVCYNISSSISSSISKEEYTPIAHANLTWPMKPLIEAFPDYLPDRITPAMIGFIEAEVKPGDEEAWTDTIRDYQQNFDPTLNRYLPDKTANILGVFRKYKTKAELNKNGNRNKKQSNPRGERSSGHDGNTDPAFYMSIGSKPL